MQAADHDRVAQFIEVAAEPLCKRWKPAILWLLGEGHHRFNGLAKCLPGVTSKVLTEQLKELVHDGIIVRHEIPGGAKHVDYTLTSAGEAYLPALDILADWGREYQFARHVSRHTSAAHPTHPTNADQHPHRRGGLPLQQTQHQSDADIGIPRIDDRHYR